MTTETRVPNYKDIADFDLGKYRRRVTSESAAAAEWVNRGLIWCFGFNHEAAVACFERASEEDVDCAMAYWGVAYALGPNYNKPWTSFGREEKQVVLKRTHDAVKAAQKHAHATSAIERALIDALRYRYQNTSITDNHNAWNKDYANAMRTVYQHHSEDLDVATLFCDALMNLTPWALWNTTTGEPAKGAATLEIQRVLEAATSTERGRRHPGLLHLHIHFWELSSTPERGLPLADRLRGLVPDSGHLNHMPSHLDILCGNYHDAVVANSAATIADEKFLDRVGSVNFYTLYRLHDYHFLVYGAMFSAQSKVALQTVERMEASLPESVLRIKSPPMADWLESFLSARIHVLIRFGRWQDIIDLALPNDARLYCCTLAITLYAKGIAYAATGRILEAETARKQFLKARKQVPSSRTLFNNMFVDILLVAAAMLDGEIEYRKKNYKSAFKHLRRAIRLDDSLPYDEPWGWMQPTRHAYGALLLEQGEVEEAMSVYKADLGIDNSLPRALRHPNNIWSLSGYHECLLKTGKSAEAEEIGKSLAEAQKHADVKVLSSCFCRLHMARSDHARPELPLRSVM